MTISKFDNITSEYFYNELINILGLDSTLRDKYLRIYSLFRELIKKITENEKRLFTSTYSRTVFFINEDKELPGELAKSIRKFRFIGAKARKDKSYQITEFQFDPAVSTLIGLIEYFSSVYLPVELIDFNQKLIKYEEKPTKPKRKDTEIELLKCVVIDRIKSNYYSHLVCESDDYGTIKLVLKKPWSNLWNLVWKGATLNVMNVTCNEDSEIVTTMSNTLISLEPDYLIDVTEIAECFQGTEEPNYLLYYLHKFKESGNSQSMFIGNVVNTIFDELLLDSEKSFDEIFNLAIRNRYLTYILLKSKIPGFDKSLYEESELQFDNLKMVVKQLSTEILSIEPTFISPQYGLQGRLDVLLEYTDDEHRKEIIELKSGKAPSDGIYCKTFDDKNYMINMWKNHFSQISCYNLLLDSTFSGRTGSSEILYSKDSVNPVRDAPNVIYGKQEVLNLRNQIISKEYSLSQGYFKFLQRINIREFGIFPKFNEEDISQFDNVYRSLSDLEMEYFQQYIKFIQNEMFTAKVGGNDKRNSSGYSSLWNDVLDSKEESFSILKDLILSKEESDFNNFHLVFRKESVTINLSSLRKGDLAILYPILEDGTTGLLKSQLIKCSIKEISESHVKVSFRNKQFNVNFFNKYFHWVVEPDFLDTSYKKLFSSVYSFVKSGSSKKELLLGMREPKREEIKLPADEALDITQLAVVEKALGALDYFLIQGPPGSGKTSHVLKYIVEYIFNNSSENILVLAFTNRAVDEICSALKRINDETFTFFRTGAKEVSEHQNVLISHLVETMPLTELYEKLNSTRVIVSTVSSVLANSEILELKEFGTAIIDEASQILEPQIIGILSKVNRFIMIGDEKQLPAVVIQDEANTKIDPNILSQINLNDMRCSLFERLLECCKKNKWTHSYGMLIKQARMHVDIQEFPNKYFYSGALIPFDDSGRQTEAQTRFKKISNNDIEKILAESRVCFIPTLAERNFKINKYEAKIAAVIIKKVTDIYGEDFNENTIGVITPFRAQCAEIYKEIEPELRSKVLVDTVERFQGSERDIIIISFAVNHEYHLNQIQSITMIDGLPLDRKLNVAITRAKEHLILLGNPEILSKSIIYNQLVEFVKEKGGYYNLDILEDL